MKLDSDLDFLNEVNSFEELKDLADGGVEETCDEKYSTHSLEERA